MRGVMSYGRVGGSPRVMFKGRFVVTKCRVQFQQVSCSRGVGRATRVVFYGRVDGSPIVVFKSRWEVNKCHVLFHQMSCPMEGWVGHYVSSTREGHKGHVL